MTQDLESLQLCLRLAAAPGNEAFKVTIELSEIDVIIEAVDFDLRSAIRGAAERCASSLREHGYAVSAAEVIGALEAALEGSELIQKQARSTLN